MAESQTPPSAPTLPTTPSKPSEVSEVISPEDVFAASAIVEDIEAFRRDKNGHEATIQNLLAADAIRSEFAELQKSLGLAREEFDRLRGLSSWDLRIATEFKRRHHEIFERAESLKESYKQILQSTDLIAGNLKKYRKKFEKHWAKAKMDPELASQRGSLKQVFADANEVMSSLGKVSELYTQIYRDGAAALDDADKLAADVEGQVEYFRETRLKKTAPSFFESPFISSFNAGLWQEARASLHDLKHFDTGWFWESRHLAWQFLLIGLFFYGILHAIWRREMLRNIIMRPLSMTLVLTLIVVSSLAQNPILPVVIGYWLVMAFLLMRIVSSYPLTRYQIRDLWLLVASYVFVQMIDSLSLPLVVYRTTIFILSLILSFLLLLRVRHVRNDAPHARLVKSGFRVLSFLMALVAFTEIIGYHLLASFLLRGTIKSGFLTFVLWNLRFIFLAVVTAFLNIALDRLHLSRSVRQLIVGKITTIFYVFIFSSLLLTLLVVWAFSESLVSAFLTVTRLSLDVNGHLFTVGSILAALLTTYLLLSFTKVLALFLKEQIYPLKNISHGTGQSINSLILYFTWVLVFFTVFTLLGFHLEQFAIIAGALSVGIGFGLQNIVNNFVSGLILLFERPIKVGDHIEVGNGNWGEVEKVGLRSTVIRSANRAQIIVPNSDFVTKSVENLTFSDPDSRIVLKIGVAYGSDTEKVKNILLSMAAQIVNVDRTSNPPQVFFTEFGDHALIFELWIFTRDISQKRHMLSELNFAVEREFREQGIEIPFPQRVVHLKSEKKDS